MKYILEALGKQEGQEDYDDIEIPVQLDIDMGNVSVIFTEPDWWIDLKELKQLIFIIEQYLMKEEENEN